MVDRFHPEKALFPVVVILVFLLLAMFVPPLWVVVGALAPVPLIFVYLRWGRGVGMVLLGLIFGVLFSLVGHTQAVLFFAEYAVLAAVLSETIQLKLPFDKCILFSTLVAAALSIVLLLFIFTDRESTLTEFFQEQIEGHFQLSMEALQAMGDKPEELKAMVTAIRNIEKTMGDDIKKPSSSETKNISVARKSIVAKMSIKKGELFTEENLTVKRPGTGVSPMGWDTVIGKAASSDYEMDDLIR